MTPFEINKFLKSLCIIFEPKIKSTLPNNQKIEKYSLTDWTLDFLQNFYINCNLFLSAFKMNQKTIELFLFAQINQKHGTNQNSKNASVFQF